MKAALFAVVALALGTALACDVEPDTCKSLDDGLTRCGMPRGAAQCSALDRSAREELTARIESLGCNGLAQSDGSVDPRVCALGGWSCPASPTPAATAARPKHPVVLVGGIDASPAFDWSPRIIAALRDAGVDVHHVKLAPWGTTPERARDLEGAIQQILREGGAEKVNLVCYAVGGLDCRYAASPKGLDRAALIASITTISTPHRGTRVADAALAALKSGTASDVLASLVGPSAPAEIPDEAALVRTLEGLTPSKIDTTIVDAEGVVYESWAGVSHLFGRASAAADQKAQEECGTYLHHPGTHDALHEALAVTAPFGGVPTDGMISVESARWGTFRGCLPADHYDVIGQIGKTTRDPATGFDAPSFYVWLASDLAERGL